MTVRKRRDRGFTLMELMVVIVIVAILAAVAVPLYINYVKDAQRTEAKGAIAAIVTAQQVHLQRYGSYVPFTHDQFEDPEAVDPQDRLDVDIREALLNWTIDVTVQDPTDAFTVTAAGKSERPSKDLQVTYEHVRSAPKANPWTEQ